MRVRPEIRFLQVGFISSQRIRAIQSVKPIQTLVLVTCMAFSFQTRSASPVLPYSERTLGYSAWSDTIRGDIANVGMAGAMVGLAESFVGTLDNPAGLSMTLMTPGIQITSNSVKDGIVQDYERSLDSNVIGATFTRYPWGLGVGYWVPNLEGQTYRHPTTNESFNASLIVKEFHASVAKVFLKNRLSVGVTFTLTEAETQLDFQNGSAFKDSSFNRVGLSGGFGAMYRLPARWILGLSYHLPYTLDGASTGDTDLGIDGFHGAVQSPFRLAVGAGYIPNRFFKFGVGFYYTGPLESAALLRDDTIQVGKKMNFQPRVGASYQFLDYRELEATFRLGTYLEFSRSLDLSSRVHMTTALEVRPWVLSFGWGLDVASTYRNYMVSAGIDVLKLFEKLDLLPPEWHPPRAGFMPKMSIPSEDGLPRPLVDHWREHQTTDILKEGKKIPGRLGKKIKSVPGELKDLGSDVLESIGGAVSDGFNAVKDAVSDDKKSSKKKKKKKEKPGKSTDPRGKAPKKP